LTELKTFLSRVLSILQKTEIPYLITGSVGSTIFGDPRATRDIDFIIDPTEAQLRHFVQELTFEYYVSLETALDALQRRFMFNVIDSSTGWKADFIIRKNTRYEQMKFQRRVQVVYLNIPINVATPEDIILSKLLWAKVSDSERQVRDAFGVVAVQGEKLDKEYLRKWAKELGVEEVLEKIFKEASYLD
jgi:hypothetical protein